MLCRMFSDNTLPDICMSGERQPDDCATPAAREAEKEVAHAKEKKQDDKEKEKEKTEEQKKQKE